MMFAKLIEDLLQVGLTEQQIGSAIGRSQPSVNRMRNGKQRPDYEAGARLVELHAERCGRREAA
jgi:hypothetical protein